MGTCSRFNGGTVLSYILTFIMLVFLSITDYKYKKIPNKITFPCMLLGLSLNGIPGFWSWFFIGVLLLFGALYLMPMGDIKMYMALCFFLSPYSVLFVLLFSQILLITFHFFKKRKNALKEIKTTSYPLAPFVLMAFVVILILQLGGVLHC